MGLCPSLGFVHCSVHVFPSTLMFAISGASGGPVTRFEERKEHLNPFLYFHCLGKRSYDNAEDLRV